MSHLFFTVLAMSLSIDCDTCSLQHSSACSSCVVSFIVSREPNEAVVVDVAEFAAMRRLQSAGLLPDLRHDGDCGVADTG